MYSPPSDPRKSSNHHPRRHWPSDVQSEKILALVGCRTRACMSDPRDLVVAVLVPPPLDTPASPSSLASPPPPFCLRPPPLSSRPSPSFPSSSLRLPRLKTCRRHPSLQATPQVSATAAQASRHLVSCTSCSTPRQSALACVQTLVGYAFDCI